MSRYFFNIRNGDDYIKDTIGTRLVDLGTVRKAAMEKAVMLLSKGQDLADAEFEITDEGGVIVEAMRFSEALPPDWAR